uniref:Uncharacterized protein n=1 Tax=Caenorhabditis japonica TaxID=281687 RepID=A0A8R1HYJ1_CAEJA
MEETKKLEKCKEERKTKRGKASDETPNGTRSKKNRKRSKSSSDDSVNEEDETFLTTSSQPSTSSASAQNVIQPIFLVVTSDNVHSVVDTIRKTLNCENPADISLNDIATDIPDSNTRMDFGNQEPIPMIPPTSTSFATQYDIEPATYCERGTMMNGEPLDYFDPPYGAEFGDLTPRQKNEPFDYAEPSASQPQTRSFGTMFENVTTCNTGTSMIDESYVSEFLRDIETQTPSFMISQRDDQQHAPQSSDDWSWRLTDTDI